MEHYYSLHEKRKDGRPLLYEVVEVNRDTEEVRRKIPSNEKTPQWIQCQLNNV